LQRGMTCSLSCVPKLQQRLCRSDDCPYLSRVHVQVVAERSSLRAHARKRIGLRQSRQHQAEERVSPCCLHECLVVLEKGWDASCAPLRVEAVYEVTKRIERGMLDQSQPNAERAGTLRPATARLVVCQPEKCTVREVHREPRRPPRAAIRQRLPEYGHIRVVTADQPPVNRLLERPHRSSDRTGSRRARTAVTGAGRDLA